MSITEPNYNLELEPDQKRVFVTQLRDEDDEEEEENKRLIRKIPIIKEKAGELIEIGFKTLQKTLLLKREAEINVVDVEFQHKKEEYKHRIAQCKLQEDELKKTEQAVKDHVKKFSKFAEETEAKKRRAVYKFNQEQRLKNKKTEEFKLLQDELEKLLLKTADLKEKIQKYSIFEKYICKVIDILPENYLEATDNMLTALMMRYHTLNETHIQLVEKLAKYNEEIEISNQIIQDLALQQSQDLLIFNKEVSVSQDNLEQLEDKNAKLELEAAKGMEKYRMWSETLARIILAIGNISLKCEEESKSKSNREDLSLFQKLDTIKNFIKEREAVYLMSRSNEESNNTNSEKSFKKRSFKKSCKSVTIKEPSDQLV